MVRDFCWCFDCLVLFGFVAMRLGCGLRRLCFSACGLVWCLVIA